MASTPDASFRSSAESPGGRSRKSTRDAAALPSPSLPSPHPSGPDSTTHDPTDAPYRAIWDHFCGLPPPASSVTFHLRDQATFESLCDRLDRQPGLLEYFEGEIWKEWDADTKKLLLRLIPIAHSIHEVTKTKLDVTIHRELDRIANDIPSLQPIREKITLAGNTHIKKARQSRAAAPEFWKVPDGQTYFGLGEYRYPPFIIEVAYSQEEKDLLNTVKTYFRKFPGKICTILGIKIQWAEEETRRLPDHFHAASVSLWITEPGDNEVSIRHSVHAKFRDDKGQVLPRTLTIPFVSFLPLEERNQHNIPAGADADLRLDFADLASYVALGEVHQRKQDKSLSRSPTPQPHEQKRKFVFKDLDGAVTEEIVMPSKRQRTESALPVASRPRTRSQSRPRRSSRVQSRGQGSE